MDLTIVIDMSGSILFDIDWPKVINFTKQVVTKVDASLPIGEETTRVAIVTFSDASETRLNLNDEFTKEGVLGKIDALRTQETGGDTNTGAALLRVSNLQTIHSAATGFRGFNLPQESVVLLITDGKPNSERFALFQASRLKENGNKIVTVGVTKTANDGALDAIASEGSAFEVENFDDLAVAVGDVLNSVLRTVLPEYVRDECPGGYLHNFATPVPGRTVELLRDTLPGLTTVEACAEACASEYTGQNGAALCQGFSFMEVSTAGLGVCRLGSSAESVAVSAPKTCGELGWEVFAASENQAVCATHQYTDTTIPCNGKLGKKTFAEAVVACDTVGARLCTGDELQSNVGVGDVCDFKSKVLLWTSDECEGGAKFELARGSNVEPVAAPLCRPPTRSRHVRCCADVSVTEAEAAVYAKTVRYYRCAVL